MNDPHFQSFDSFEDMQKFMKDNHDAAMAGMGAHQRALLGRRAFCWVRPYPQMRIFIFGDYDVDRWIDNERTLGKAEGTWSEAEAREIEHRCLTRGYLSGTCYSPVEPTGEIGDTHVSQVYELSRPAFEQARQAGWVVDKTTFTTSPVLYAELAAYAASEPVDLREVVRGPRADG